MERCLASEAALHGARSLPSNEQKRDVDVMANVVRGRPQEYIRNQAMPVCAHCNKVAALFFHPFYDFLGGIAVSEFGICFDGDGKKLVPNFFQISLIFDNLVANRFGP